MASQTTEMRTQEALDYYLKNPDSKVATIAREFGISRQRLQRRLQGINQRPGWKAHNTKLTRPEEAALCRYIDRLDVANFSVRPEFITDAANYILKERSSSSSSASVPTVGKLWTTRFIRRHRYLRQRQQMLDSNRQSSEDVNRVIAYFNSLRKVIDEEGVIPEDIWNMDETGFRIGVGKDQLIITKRKRAHLFSMPENRESATAIEAIATDGRHLPLFLILSGQLHMSNWYRQQLDEATVIAVSPTGYSNDQLSFQWIQHFDRHASSIGSKRLLILDGHGSHHTIEFIEYCEAHGIIPFAMPPHLTHLLQPLDVAVFQPLKHYHAKALDILVRDGIINITKLEFLSIIQQVRDQAFKASTIKSAFKKTGIWPFNPQLVIQQLVDRAPAHTPSPEPAGLPSSDFSTPVTLRQINKVAGKLEGILKEEELDDELSYNLSRFIRGSLIAATELIQTKRDLSKTKKAERANQLRRASKNKPLKSGGILTVEEGRRMSDKAGADEIARARRLVEAAEKKAHNNAKKVFFEAAKKARSWRISGQLKPLEIWDSNRGYRVVRRG